MPAIKQSVTHTYDGQINDEAKKKKKKLLQLLSNSIARVKLDLT
jgi:hypothetical protein